MNQERQRIAVIGAGVSGLTAAWLLADKLDVHLFEAGDYAGGHTNTEQVEVGGRTWPVNTGFIVFNDWTYPNFIKLMDRLGVASEVSNMSFSVDCHASGLQYNGTSLNTLFAQRRNLFNLNFLKMIREILRFNKETRADLAAGTIPDGETLGEYLNRNGYSRYFRNYYIVPMGAAIWSAPEIVLEQFPIRFFLQFFNNHGMLSV
ncbi:MAG: FAD-dependent oxidoreductase, partial [Pseudomonadota bacterium]|nr:FAD-dependent oxidoreductase [Pseudomonadota bacterium]